MADELPFPIAFSYSLIRAARDATARYERLLRCYEAVVRYCATVQLSDYLAAGCPDAELNRTLLSRLTRPLSLGQWVELTRQVTALQQRGVFAAFMPELAGFYFKASSRPSLTDAARLFEQALLSARNDWAHPDQTWAPDACARRFAEHRPLLDRLLEALGFLARYTLYVPYRGPRPEMVREAFRLMGPSEYPELETELELPLTPAISAHLEYETTAFLVSSEDRGRQLLLHPLSLFANRDGVEDVFLFEGCELHRGALRRVSYRGNRIGQQPLAVVPGSGYERLVEDFRAVISRLGASPPAAAEEQVPEDLSAHYFAAQRAAVEEHTRRFVGRTDAVAALDRFLARQPRGYFIVQAGPGAGKTAFASHLVKTREYVHHFVTMSGGRADHRLILRSLLAQLIPLAGAAPRLPESVPELNKMLEDVLAHAAGRRKQLVLVVDALDELPSEGGPELPFLVTEALPAACYVVVTARPGERLEQLKATVAGLPTETYELGPLTLAEARELLRARRPDIGEAEIAWIAEAARGSPLYLKAVLDELERNPQFNLAELPPEIEGFFRRATAAVAESPILREVLGLIAVARRPLSLRELAQITGAPQREIHERAIRPIRHFLVELNDAYGLYHARFQDFVRRELLFGDELARYHRRLADWLQQPACRASDYRCSSLTHHLFEAGDPVHLKQTIDRDFLVTKLRRFGYAVLEDVELLSRSLLEAGDAASLERSVGMVEALREVVGGDIIQDAGRAIRADRLVSSRGRGTITPPTPSVPGLDVFAGILPRVEVSADFVEIVPRDGRLVVAIGDAPSTGLKSAFVARYIANVFRRAVEGPGAELLEVMDGLDAMISAHPYFESIAMLAAELDPANGVLTLVGAGHTPPVLYSARRRACDRLPLRGVPLRMLLPPLPPDGSAPQRFDRRQAELHPGDVLVLVSDGLTEGHLLQGTPYGYRFTRLIEEGAGQSARQLGEAILDDWRAHHREGDYADDVTVVVIALPGERLPEGQTA